MLAIPPPRADRNMPPELSWLSPFGGWSGSGSETLVRPSRLAMGEDEAESLHHGSLLTHWVPTFCSQGAHPAEGRARPAGGGLVPQRGRLFPQRRARPAERGLILQRGGSSLREGARPAERGLVPQGGARPTERGLVPQRGGSSRRVGLIPQRGGSSRRGLLLHHGPKPSSEGKVLAPHCHTPSVTLSSVICPKGGRPLTAGLLAVRWVRTRPPS